MTQPNFVERLDVSTTSTAARGEQVGCGATADG